MPDEDDFRYRGDNDPYNDAERPDFLSKNSTAEDELKQSESNALSGNSPLNDASSPANFISNVTGNKNSNQKTKSKFSLKGKGPIGIVIAILLILGGGLFLGGQSLMPFAIANRVIEEYNSMGYSNNLRSKIVIRYLADNNKLSKKAIKQLEAQGIEVKTKNKKQVFSFEDSKGVKHTDLEFKDVIDMPEFKMKYDAGSKLYAGQFGGWFDGIATKVFTRLGITRSRWDDWDGTKTGEVDPETGKNEIEEKFKETAENPKNETSTSNKNMSEDSETKELKDAGESNETIKKTDSKAIRTKLENVAKVSNTAQLACGGVMALTALHTIVSAMQTSDMLNLASGYLESTQKIQAGEGNNSPMQLYNNQLTTTDENGKSAMSSAGMSMLFNGSSENYSNSSDESLQKANTEAAVSLPGAATILASSGVCIGLSAALISGASLIISIIPGAGQAYAFGKIILGMTAGAVIGGVLPIIIEKLAEIIATDVIADMVGEDAGNYLVAGSSIYTGKNHQASGGAPGDEEKTIAFKQAEETVLAEQAELDRKTLSPLDTSSRYTFLGSILYNMFPYILATSDNTFSEILSSTSAIASNSIISLLPTSSALGITRMVTATNSCPFLEEVNAVGDAFCNPYYVDDTSTLNLSVEEVIDKLYPKNIDNKDLDKANIVPNSPLAKFRQFCGNRDSSYGLLDGNILSQLTVDTSSNVIDGAIGSAPIVGDALDMLNNLQLSLSGDEHYVDGSYCIASSKSPDNYWETQGKYYQRFLSDQRIMANASDDRTALSRYDDEYYAEHPIDTSYEAVLARLSGQTKEQIIAQLNELEYQEFIANYDASDRYSFNSTPVNQDIEVNLNLPEDTGKDIIIASSNATFNPFIYADLRSQSITV